MTHIEKRELVSQINDAASELIRLLVNNGISEQLISSIDYDVSVAIDEIWENE